MKWLFLFSMNEENYLERPCRLCHVFVPNKWRSVGGEQLFTFNKLKKDQCSGVREKVIKYVAKR